MTLPGGLRLRIAGLVAGRSEQAVGPHDQTAGPRYPTRRLQKGLLLCDGEQELAEEGVGFGVPILKRGAQTIFPGAVDLQSTTDGPVQRITAAYRLDLVERLSRARGGNVRPGALYAAKDSLAALHRRVPALRRPLAAVSSAGRRVLGWSTIYEPAAFSATLPVTYTLRAGGGAVAVAADLTGLAEAGVTEVVFMNELGAHEFDRYEDSDGAVLRGADIGTWDEVTARTARFVSTRRRVAFALDQAPGARLHRGRELVGSRLAWAGFGYSLPPALGRFAYELRIERPA